MTQTTTRYTIREQGVILGTTDRTEVAQEATERGYVVTATTSRGAM